MNIPILPSIDLNQQVIVVSNSHRPIPYVITKRLESLMIDYINDVLVLDDFYNLVKHISVYLYLNV